MPSPRTFAALLLGCLPALAAAAEPPAPAAGVPGMEAQRIDEPVFGGHMVVYEAGRGRGRPVLLVHGIGQSGARDWRETVAWLKQTHHVVAVDLPGFGASDKANVLYSPANYVRVLKHVADRFLQKPFALAGHSMGAVVALRYAASYPRDVSRLVVIDAPGILHRNSVTARFLAFLGMRFMPPWLDPLQELLGLARRALAPLERLHLDPRVILESPELRASVLGGDPVKIAGLAVVSENLAPDLPEIGAETLLLWGAEDGLAPPRTGHVLALTLAHARLEIVAGAGHTPMLEAPQEFRRRLEPFLERGLEGLPPPAAAPMQKHGAGSCRDERDAVFEGDYDTLVLERCLGASIRHARVRELRVADSRITIDDSVIGGGETGMQAANSTVVATGVRFEGEVAIRASASRLDLAAVDVRGSQAAVVAPVTSFVVFSLSKVHSPNLRGEVHAFFTVTPDSPL
jgi:pimeloyl-ACP methyl ester carboxylesterase